MSHSLDKDDFLRNRISDALRELADAESDADIEAILDAEDAEPFGEEDMHRIMGKMRALSGFDSTSESTSTAKMTRSDVRSTSMSFDMQRPGVRTRSSAMTAVIATCICLLTVALLFESSDHRTSTEIAGIPTQGIKQLGAELEPALLVPAASDTYFAHTKLFPAEQKARLQVGQSFETGNYERRRLSLPDGSVLFVNQQTRGTVLSNRHVRLDGGEVYAEVVPAELLAEGETDRFVIETPERSVTALGTRFAVQADGRSTAVHVTQGKVQVSGFSRTVDAGQELSTTLPDAGVGPEALPGLKPAPRASEVLAWTQELVPDSGIERVPESRHRGGSLIVVDPSGQEMKLSLRRFHVDVHIEDGFARTTIDQTYFNHSFDRQEGTFRFPLPPDASLSRLAMYVNGKLMEGGMVERDHGRNVYEQIRYTRRDPALLEWVDGSTFKMRVFPLEPRQEKRLVLSYTQRLPNDYDKTVYRFPGGHSLEQVGEWTTRLRVVKGKSRNDRWFSPSHVLKADTEDGDLILEGQTRNAALDKDLVVELKPRKKSKDAESVRFTSFPHEGHRYLMMRFRPDLKGKLQRPKRNWVILFESSGDRNPLLARVQVDVVRTLLENSEHSDTFDIVRASTETERFRRKPVECSKKNIDDATEFLEKSHLVGALDLGGALKECRRLSKPNVENWIVHVGSAVPVLGERAEAELLKLLPKGGRYAGIGIGKRWSRSFMKSAAGRSGGHFAQINPDEKVGWRAFEFISTLNAPRLLNIRIRSDRKQQRFLGFADTIAHGQEIAAITRIAAGAQLPTKITVTGTIGAKSFDRSVPIKVVSEGAGYLPRIWSRLEIDRLVSDGAEKNKQRIINFSKSMYVMSPFTSLLVLENEAMYDQFAVDRGRKDHWALYAAPQNIEVVYEPDGREFTREGTLAEMQQRLVELRGEMTTARINLDKLGSRVDQSPEQRRVLSRQLAATHERAMTFEKQTRAIEKVYREKKAEPLQQLAVRYSLRTSLNDAILVDPFNSDSREPGYSRRVALGINDEKFDSGVQKGVGSGLRRLSLLGNEMNLDVRPTQWFDQVQWYADAWSVPHLVTAETLREAAKTMPGITDRFGTTRIASPVTMAEPGPMVAGSGPGRLTMPASIVVPDRRYWAFRALNQTTQPHLEKLFAGVREFGRNDLDEELLPMFNVLQQRSNARFLSRFDVNTDGYIDESLLVDQMSRSRGGMLGGGNTRGTSREAGFRTGQLNIDPLRTALMDFDFLDLDLAEKYGIKLENRGINGRLSRRSRTPGQGNINSLRNADLFASILQERDSDYGMSLGFDSNANDRDALTSFGMIAPQPAELSYFFELPKRELRGFEDPIVNWDALSSQLERMPYAYKLRARQAVQQSVLVDPVSAAPGMDTSITDVLGVLDEESPEADRPKQGTVDPRALSLIEAARSAGWQKITLPSHKNGPEQSIVCNGQGQYVIERSLSSGLVEKVVCDGRNLWHVYDELQLVAKRTVNRRHRQAVGSMVPWFVPGVEDLTFGADVHLVEDNVIRIVPHGSGNEQHAAAKRISVELQFGDDGRLLERRIVTGRNHRVLIRLRFASDGNVDVFSGKCGTPMKIAFRRSAVEAPSLTPALDGFVVMPLPFRSVDSLKHLLADSPGDEEPDYSNLSEEDALRLAGAYFAARQPRNFWQVLNQVFFKKNDFRLGFAVLIASSSPMDTTATKNATAKEPDSPLSQFLNQYLTWYQNGNVEQEFLLNDGAGPFVTQQTKQHNVWIRWSSARATRDRTLSQILPEWTESLKLAQECRSPAVSWALLHALKTGIDASTGSKEAALRTLADAVAEFETKRGWSSAARLTQVRWLLDAGDEDKADSLYRELLQAIAKAGIAPTLHQDLHNAYRDRLNADETWRESVRSVASILKENDHRVAIQRLALECLSLSETELAESLFESAVRDIELKSHPELAVGGLIWAHRTEKWRQAEGYVALLLDNSRRRKHSGLWREASLIAASLGDEDESLRRLEKAMNLEFKNLPEMINVEYLRNEYGSLFDRYSSLVESLQKKGQPISATLVERICGMADRWRSVDPDPNQPCLRAGQVLDRLRETDLAWAYWTTPLSANPDSSEAWTSLAQSLSTAGRFVQADDAWSQAFKQEPTNPDILWQHAHLLQSRGRNAEAKRLFAKIARGNWQPRFSATKEQAKQMLK